VADLRSSVICTFEGGGLPVGLQYHLTHNILQNLFDVYRTKSPSHVENQSGEKVMQFNRWWNQTGPLMLFVLLGVI
jgi:hypothetical protein